MKKKKNASPKYRRLLKTKYTYGCGDDTRWVRNQPASPARKKDPPATFIPPEKPPVLNSFQQPNSNLGGLDSIMEKYAKDIENGRNLQKRFNS